MPCRLIFNRLKTGDSGHWFKISPQFFLNPKPTVPRGSAKRASMLRENGLLGLKKLSYFPLLVYTFHCFFLA